MKHSTKIMVALSLGLATLGMSVPFSMVRAEDPASVMTEASNEEREVLDQVEAYVKAWQLEDAIALLEGVVAEGSQLPEVYQKLGDLYQQAGYDAKQAAESYVQAMQLAQASEDLRAAADAQVALGKILAAEGYPNEARQILAEAKSNYEAVGNSQQATAVEEQLVAISNQTNESSSRPTLRGEPQDAEQSILDVVNPAGCLWECNR
jgi:tetratricopeptide (TPR) repeat protein